MIVVERASELPTIVSQSRQIGVRPSIGFRLKLATRGSGRWQASGGYRSKFGLTVYDALAQLEWLRSIDMQDCLQLLHFHLGSQIGNIRHLKSAILEASRIYVDLVQRGAGLRFMDVGGGLGVDYDGSQTDTPSSMNYTLQEYANDVVYHVMSVCDESGIAHPELISESGRAVAAHHSVLVFETLGVASQGIRVQETPSGSETTNGNGSERHPLYFTEAQVANFENPVRDLWDSFKELNSENLLETFHDAQVALDLCMNLFSGGYLPLEQRAIAEQLYFSICHRVRRTARQLPAVPAELVALDRMLSDIYFVNFSLFQSLPDAWAIEQLFPIMPIHRLDERPTQDSVIGDITCDSDGKVDSFICDGKHRSTLRLHSFDPEQPYRLGVFLVGAYQEILGDLHNLFGDTHAVHVDMSDEHGVPTENVEIQSIVRGDTVREVLSYVQYDNNEVLQNLESAVESAVRLGKIDDTWAQELIETYTKAINEYTYLTTHQQEQRMNEEINTRS